MFARHISNYKAKNLCLSVCLLLSLLWRSSRNTGVGSSKCTSVDRSSSKMHVSHREEGRPKKKKSVSPKPPDFTKWFFIASMLKVISALLL